MTAIKNGLNFQSTVTVADPYACHVE